MVELVNLCLALTGLIGIVVSLVQTIKAVRRQKTITILANQLLNMLDDGDLASHTCKSLSHISPYQLAQLAKGRE